MPLRPVLFTSALIVLIAAAAPIAGGVPQSAPAQAPSPLGPADLSTLENFLPREKPANLQPSPVPDLSGSWMSAPYQSISMADRPGRQRGKEPDIDNATFTETLLQDAVEPAR